MSRIASAVKTNDSSFSSSQEIDLTDKDNCTTATISETDNFDLSDKTFPLVFQNIKPCQYTNFSNISLKTNNMMFLHVNIRSLQKNYEELYQFVSELPLKPLIIYIAGIKLKGISDVNISLPRYVFIHKNSSTNAGGVRIYISINLCFKKTFNAKLPHSESLWNGLKSNFQILAFHK